MRHGKATYKDGNIFAGITDFPLDREGAESSGRVAGDLSGEGIQAVYSSFLRRSYETAEPIAKKLKLDVERIRDFNELDFGIFEGLSPDKAREMFPKLFEQRESDKWEFRPPEGESFRDGAERAYPKLLELIERHSGQTILVVTHWCIIKGLLILLLGTKLSELRNTRFHFGCRMFINIEGGKVTIEKTEGIDGGLPETADEGTIEGSS